MKVASDEEIDDLSVDVASNSSGLLSSNLIDTIVDFLADMVVNSVIAAMAVHQNPSSHTVFYHISSSMRNQLIAGDIAQFFIDYFKKSPWIDERGKPVKVKEFCFLNSMLSNTWNISSLSWLNLACVMSLLAPAPCHCLHYAAVSAMPLPRRRRCLCRDTVLTMLMPSSVPYQCRCNASAMPCLCYYLHACPHRCHAPVVGSCAQGCLAITPAPWLSLAACYLIATTASHCLP
ncbi:hypothetical protein CQW23_32182 [Capsicum baccatum]|uniref:Uncharacterized protein n=1 Tax=Capsicum baccatum TaxID=33114 RepID=A0A2G2V5J4_CAPBA|nr:hypothetical protein CQW23_32182 [Capsicum baccatum]